MNRYQKTFIDNPGRYLMHYKYIKKIKSGNGWRYFYNQNEIDAYNNETKENTINPDNKQQNNKTEKYKEKLKKSINKKVDKSSKSINVGRSAVERKMNKVSNAAKSEARGIKRASDSIRGKGNNWYDAHDTAPKTYVKYNKRKIGKRRKTGKVERAMIYAYRKTHPYE